MSPEPSNANRYKLSSSVRENFRQYHPKTAGKTSAQNEIYILKCLCSIISLVKLLEEIDLCEVLKELKHFKTANSILCRLSFRSSLNGIMG